MATVKFKFINEMNRRGIPIPLLRVDGKASLTATMCFISFNTCIFGQFGKLAGYFGGIDLTQASYLFMICLGAYLGRKFQGDGTKVTIISDEKEDT